MEIRHFDACCLLRLLFTLKSRANSNSPSSSKWASCCSTVARRVKKLARSRSPLPRGCAACSAAAAAARCRPADTWGGALRPGLRSAWWCRLTCSGGSKGVRGGGLLANIERPAVRQAHQAPKATYKLPMPVLTGPASAALCFFVSLPMPLTDSLPLTNHLLHPARPGSQSASDPLT